MVDPCNVDKILDRLVLFLCALFTRNILKAVSDILEEIALQGVTR